MIFGRNLDHTFIYDFSIAHTKRTEGSWASSPQSTKNPTELPAWLAARLPLRRYYSSSLSPYGACSTSHYDRHCATAQENYFWMMNLECGDCISRPNLLTFDIQEICSHETNFVAPQLHVESIELNEILHGARYYKYLDIFLTKCFNRNDIW